MNDKIPFKFPNPKQSTTIRLDYHFAKRTNNREGKNNESNINTHTQITKTNTTFLLQNKRTKNNAIEINNEPHILTARKLLRNTSKAIILQKI